MEPLTGQANYRTWKIRMEALLRPQGLLQAASGSLLDDPALNLHSRLELLTGPDYRTWRREVEERLIGRFSSMFPSPRGTASHLDTALGWHFSFLLPGRNW